MLFVETAPEAIAAANKGMIAIPVMHGPGQKLNRCNIKFLKEELAKIPLQGHPIYLAFNEKYKQERTACRKIQQIAEVCKAKDLKVSFLWLPADRDGSSTLPALLETLDEAGLLAMATEEDLDVPEEENGSAAENLVKLADKVYLFRNERGQAYAHFDPLSLSGTPEAGGHCETRAVRSAEFRGHLSRSYYDQYGKVVASQAMENSLRLLEAMTLSRPEHPLGLRTVTDDNGDIWIDLGDSTWNAVRITKAGFSVMQPAGPLFRRHAGTAPQVEPVAGGDLSELTRFANVRDEQSMLLLIAWLAAGLMDNIVHPILVVSGEQGSAKSTLVRFMRTLIDPSRVPLRTVPRDIASWVQVLDQSWLICFDNVSRLSEEISDAACRAVTGDGFEKRRLYSDEDSILFNFRRVLALNGVEVVAERADLLERSLLLPLVSIPPNMRRLESEILAEFEAARPRLVGALYDLVAGILRELPNVHLTQMPRPADFTRIGVAVERVLNYPEGTFLSAMTGNAEEQNDEALQASPIALAVIALMSPDSPFYKTANDMLPEGTEVFRFRNPWQGTANRLLTQLTTLADDQTRRSQTWPKVPRSLGTMLRRIAPNLRAAGIDVAFDRGREQNIILTRQNPGGPTDITDAPTPPLGIAPGALTQTVWPAPQTVAAATQNEPPPYGYTEYRDDGDGDDAGYPPHLAGNYQPQPAGYRYIPETDFTDLFPGAGPGQAGDYPAQDENIDPHPGRYDDDDKWL